jgi:hypothetical protein
LFHEIWRFLAQICSGAFFRLERLGRSRVLLAFQLLILFTDLDFYFEDIVFEVAFFVCAVWENHLSVAVLNASDPLTVVAAAVRPVHLSVAVPLVLFVFTLVDVAACPLEDTIAVLPVVQVVTLVTVTLGAASTAPLAFALLHSGFKVAHVAGTIGPSVLAFSIGLAVHVFTRVGVSVDKYVCACAVLEADVPFPFVSVAVLPSVNTIAMSLALVPLANVTVIVESTPDSVPVLQTSHPFAIVHFSVHPCVDTLAIGFAHLEVSVV